MMQFETVADANEVALVLMLVSLLSFLSLAMGFFLTFHFTLVSEFLFLALLG